MAGMAPHSTQASDDDESWTTVSASDYHSAVNFDQWIGPVHERSPYSHNLDPGDNTYHETAWHQQNAPHRANTIIDASFSYLTTGLGSGALPTHPLPLHQNPQGDVLGSQSFPAQTPTAGDGYNNEPWLESSNDSVNPSAGSLSLLMGDRQISPAGSFDSQILFDDNVWGRDDSQTGDTRSVNTTQIVPSTGEGSEGFAQDHGRDSEPWNPFAVVSNQSLTAMHRDSSVDQALPSMYSSMSLNDHGNPRTFSSASNFSHLSPGPSTTWNSSTLGQGTTDTSFPLSGMYDSVATLRPASGQNDMPTPRYASGVWSAASTESVYYDAESRDDMEVCHQNAIDAMSADGGPSRSSQLLDIPAHSRPAAAPPSPAVSVTSPDVAKVLWCPQRGCRIRFTGNYRRGNLQRHMRLKHGLTERLYLCEYGGCGKSFKRQDARLKHYRKKHSMPAREPAAEPH